MEDPSEINTIYSIHNFQKITNSQQHVNINNYNNIDTNNVIEEEKESKKVSKENISKNNNKTNYLVDTKGNFLKKSEIDDYIAKNDDSYFIINDFKLKMLENRYCENQDYAIHY